MILVTGADGLLGKTLCNALTRHDFVATNKTTLNILSKNEINKCLNLYSNTKIIVNCAAGSNAEYIERNQDYGYKITVEGPRYLADECAKRGIKLIYISSDYVFDGLTSTPYKETDLTNPLSAYGRFKVAGEQEVINRSETCAVIRTSWLYKDGKRDFLGLIQASARTNNRLRVVYDQVGTPTYVPNLAKVIIRVADELTVGEREIFHYSAEGVCSWYDFAVLFFKRLGVSTLVEPILSEEYPTLAMRPKYSVLNKSKIKSRFSLTINHFSDELDYAIHKYFK